MSRLDAAMKHLSAALDSLGMKMAGAAAAGAGGDQQEPANAELRAERDRLLARLAELERESRTLSNVSEEIEARLDGAIAEIREVLARAA
jgi:Domain of unknown function (DUF4164)